MTCLLIQEKVTLKFTLAEQRNFFFRSSPKKKVKMGLFSIKVV
jgi:hypothetical protein